MILYTMCLLFSQAYMNVSFDANLKKVASDLFITSSGKVIHEYALQDFKTVSIP